MSHHINPGDTVAFLNPLNSTFFGTYEVVGVDAAFFANDLVCFIEDKQHHIVAAFDCELNILNLKGGHNDCTD
jgi:hypothetical protein